MKTVKALICLILILFAFSSCGSKKQTETTTNSLTTPYESTAFSLQNEATTTAPTTVPTTVPTPVPTTTVPETVSLPLTTESVTTTADIFSSAYETTTCVTTAATEATQICYLTIVCDTVLQNKDKLKSSKEAFVPSKGVILSTTAVKLNDGETAFDIIKRACKENKCDDKCKYCDKNGIQIEYTYTPAFDNYYIESIHQLYEKDCGMQSGWMYSVNGEFPTVGVSAYSISPGDSIVFAYTCDMGQDVGNIY